MSIVVVEDAHVTVVEPTKPEAPPETDAERHEFIQKRRSMEINEFRRPSLAELQQEEIDEEQEEPEEGGDGPAEESGNPTTK